MKKFTTALLAAAALLASGGAMAQAYVGGSLGFSELDIDCDGWGSCDKSDVGFKLFGGYKFTPYVAIEGSYIDYGKANLSDPGFSAEVTGTSFGIGVAGFLPFNQMLTGIGRVGFASNKAKATGVNIIGGSETNTKPYFGIGLDFMVAKNLHVEAALDFTKFEQENDSATARLLSAGVRYEF
jgi:OOP family OmpA-OmpF porin